jgi:hypothetical protein
MQNGSNDSVRGLGGIGSLEALINEALAKIMSDRIFKTVRDFMAICP